MQRYHDQKRTMLSTITLLSILTTVSACPSQCTCDFGEVTCNDVTGFPTNIPEDTDFLQLNNVSGELALGYLSELPDLAMIVVDGGEISIGDNGFRGSQFISFVEFSNARITRIGQSAFSEFGDYIEFAFQDCAIDAIETEAFSYLSDVEILFTGTTIGRMETSAFRNISEAYAIKFVNSRISKVETRAFDSLSSVEQLLFDNVTISSLATESFYRFDNVDVIAFRSCYINDTHSRLFAELASVKKIEFTDASMNRIDAYFLYMSNGVRLLDFTNCVVGEVMGCAFADISNQAMGITIVHSRLGRVNSNAFSNLTIRNLVIDRNTTIGNLRRLALVDLDLAELRVEKAYIESWKSYGMYRISVGQFSVRQSVVVSMETSAIHSVGSSSCAEVYGNTIVHLSCDAIANMTSSFCVHSNLLTCNCSLAWMLDPSDPPWLKSVCIGNTSLAITTNHIANMSCTTSQRECSPETVPPDSDMTCPISGSCRVMHRGFLFIVTGIVCLMTAVLPNMRFL